MNSEENIPAIKTNSSVLRIVFWALFLILSAFAAHWLISYRSSFGILNPKTAVDHYLLGKTLMERRQFREAEQHLKKAIQMDDSLSSAHLTLGKLYFDTIHYDAALEASLKAAQLLKDTKTENEERIYYNLGNMYERKKEYESAWNYLRKSYEMKNGLDADFWPEDPKKHTYFVAHDDHDGYIRIVTAAERLNNTTLPGEVFVWQTYFQKLDKERNYGELFREGEYFINDHPGGEYNYIVHESLTHAYLSKKRYNDALRHLKLLESSELDNEHRAFQKYSYFYYFLSQENYDQALASLDEIIKNYEHYENIQEVYYSKASLLRRMGKFDAESDVLKQITVQFPNSRLEAYANYRLSALALLRGNHNDS